MKQTEDKVNYLKDQKTKVIFLKTLADMFCFIYSSAKMLYLMAWRQWGHSSNGEVYVNPTAETIESREYNSSLFEFL